MNYDRAKQKDVARLLAFLRKYVAERRPQAKKVFEAHTQMGLHRSKDHLDALLRRRHPGGIWP